MRRLPTLTLIFAAPIAYGHQISGLCLEYEVHQTRPKILQIGIFRAYCGKDVAYIEFKQPSHLHASLLLPNTTLHKKCLVHKERSEQGEIWPGGQLGRVWHVPLLGKEMIGVEGLRRDASSGQTMALLTDVASLAYWPAEVTWIKREGTRLPKKVTIPHQGKTAIVWEYDGYLRKGLTWVPKKITRYRYKASGLNIPEDDVVAWTLKAAKHIKSPIELSIGDFFPTGATIHDYRIPNEPITFRNYPAEGSIFEQAEAARKSAKPETTKAIRG